MNILDRAITSISPAAGLRRQQARLQLKMLGRVGRDARAYYDGADKGRRTASIRRKIGDANQVTHVALDALRQASRDLKRNNPYAARAAPAIVNNMIGRGIEFNIRHDDAGRQQELREVARAHFETTACDVDGRHTLAGLQGLTAETMVDSGEALVRRVRKRPSDNLPLPFQLQVLEPDHLDIRRNGLLKDGRSVVQGVEFDANGQRSGYWLFPRHPGSGIGFQVPTSVFVPASEIIHVYRVDRPGQVRGIPWNAPVVLRLSDFNDYQDAQLVRQKIAAAYAVFKINMGDTLTGDEETDTQETIEPGTITEITGGQDIKFGSPPGVDGHAETASVYLHEIAAGYGVSYEALTGDLRGVSFSSGRMGWLEFERNIQSWRWRTFIPQFCLGVCTWMLEGMVLIGLNTDGVTVSHIPPARQMIDPTREVPALRDEIRGGLKSWSQALREKGLDPDSHWKEYEEDIKLIHERGLILDTDPRAVSRAGLTQARPAGSEIPQEDDDG